MAENTEITKTNKTIYKTKNYVPRQNPIGRPAGLTKQQEKKKIRYKLEYEGKTYYATSLNEIASFFGIHQYKVYMINKRTMKNDDNKFSKEYLKHYSNVAIYDVDLTNETHKRGVLTDDFKHVDDVGIKFEIKDISVIENTGTKELLINSILNLMESYYLTYGNNDNNYMNVSKPCKEYFISKLKQ